MSTDPDLFVNPYAGPLPDVPAAASIEVHRRLPHYAPTPLVDAVALARELGVGRLWVKDESSRLGLPSFKILGASYATYRMLAERLGGIDDGWRDIDDLRKAVSPLRPFTLAAATDGNHGRAVARMARLLDFGARIYVPNGTTTARIEAIEGEGATVEVVDGDYDAAVRRSAADEGERCAVVSDTSWPGYERVPGWVIDGYATVFAEVDETLAERGDGPPTLVVIPVGVGALAAATIRHYRTGNGAAPRILGVEPEDAACVQASLRAGELATVPGPHRSIMAGLNCGTPSRIAWPSLRRGLDAVVAIDDDAARDAMRALATVGVVSGETGAAALGGLRKVLADQGLRAGWRLGEDSRVLVLSTEGATDPEAYQQIVGEAVRSESR
ncbi:MAG TPA: diaminopropionate ammonia-lyase [Streptosporangiales bacterium]